MRTHGRGREPGVRPNSYLSMSVRLLTLYRMSRAARSENAMKLRWADVRARRFHDEGRGVWRFRKRWEAPSSLRYRRTRRTRRLSCLCGRRHETGGNTGAWTCRPGGSGRNSTHHLWNYRPTLSLYTRTGLAICGVWSLTGAELTIKCTNPSRCVCLRSLNSVGEGYGPG